MGRSVREDLIALLRVMCDDMSDPRRIRAAALLHGEGAKYPRLMARFTETVAEPVVGSILGLVVLGETLNTNDVGWFALGLE